MHWEQAFPYPPFALRACIWKRKGCPYLADLVLMHIFSSDLSKDRLLCADLKGTSCTIQNASTATAEENGFLNHRGNGILHLAEGRC
jgi:hypothetical protein